MYLLSNFTLRLFKTQKISLHLLPRYRQPPRRSGSEGAVGHAFPTPESYFRKQYFEFLDLLISELKC